MLWLSREEFAEAFKELYPSSEALDTYFLSISSVSLIGRLVVSDRKLSELAAAGVSKLNDHGYVHITVSGK